MDAADKTRLLALHELDRKLDALVREVNTAQTTLDKIRAEQASLSDTVQAEAEKLRKLQLSERSTEAEIAELDTACAKAKANIESASSQAMLEAAQRSFASLAEKRDACESHGLELIEQVETTTALIAKHRGMLDALAAREATANQGLLDIRARNAVQLEALNAERDAAIAQLTPSTRERYQHIFVTVGYPALAKVAENSCKVCGCDIATQIMSQVVTHALPACPGCKRFLAS